MRRNRRYGVNEEVSGEDLARAVGRLDERQRRVLGLRYDERHTQREVAQTLGVSKGRAQQIEHAALKELRCLLGVERKLIIRVA
jgi:RNA polymerase sigma factor (sigma-70 family)